MSAASKYVDAKQLRATFRRHILKVTDKRTTKHLLGIGPRVIDLPLAISLLHAVIADVERWGNILAPDLAKLRTRSGARPFVASLLRAMARVELIEGRNHIETAWLSLGDLIAVGKNGRHVVYTAKASAVAADMLAAEQLVDSQNAAAMQAAERRQRMLRRERVAKMGASE